jgi:hypothetical protein
LAQEDALEPMQLDQIEPLHELTPNKEATPPEETPEQPTKPIKKKRAARKAAKDGAIMDGASASNLPSMSEHRSTDVMTLDAKDYRQSREKYTELLKHENDEIEAKRTAKRHVEMARKMVWGAPALFSTCCALGALPTEASPRTLQWKPRL